MGFVNIIGSRVRGFFAREPERQAMALVKSDEYSERPDMGYGTLLDYYGLNGLGRSLEISQNLMRRYIDYEHMEDYPEISASYDIYADDSTQPDMLRNVTIWSSSPDKQIEESLNRLLHKTLRIEDDIWPLARTLVKYGNVFAEELVTADGVIGLNYLPVPTVRRIETERGQLVGFVQDTAGRFENITAVDFVELLRKSYEGQSSTNVTYSGQRITVFENWEVAHWRLSSKHLRSIYGYGIGEPARWIWKRLMMLEDAALIFKLTRAPSRYAFYVDTGALDQDRALAYVDKVARRLKRKKFVNPSTGKLDFRYNPLCLSGDTEIPLLDGRKVALRQLVDEYDDGKENWVYSVDRKSGNRVVPGKIIWAGGTRKNASMVEVTLDNGKSVRCTPDHKWIMRSGEYCEAKDLKAGDSLMPWKTLVTSKDTLEEKSCQMVGCEMVYDPSVEKVAMGCNHKVQSVQFVEEREDTFTLTVEKYHNFAVSAGVYIKNSMDEDFFLPTREGRDSTRIDVLSGPDYQCLTGNTRIPLMDGTVVTMSELAERDGDFWVYSLDEAAKVVPGKAHSCRSTKVEEVLEIELDNGEVVECSGNHPFLTRDGKWIRADQLETEQSLMPLYRRMSDKYKENLAKEYEVPAHLNHKVIAVRRTGRVEQLYDLTVDEHHNFALEAGVFVHNSTEDIEYFLNKLFAALKVPKTYLGRMEDASKAVLCLTGDTMVPLLDGNQKSMRDLSEEYGQDKEFWVYSVDENGQIVPGRASNSRITKRNAEVWEVELDNGETVRGTADHPFMMRDGSFRELSDLKAGDSLMPLYRRKSSHESGQKLDGYEQVLDPMTNDWIYTHRLVGKAVHGAKMSGEVWHHKSFDKTDNCPMNIESLDSRAHMSIHAKFSDKTLGRSDVIAKRMKALQLWYSSDELKEHCRANLKAIRADKGSGFWKWLSSDEHKSLKSVQMKKQWADEDGLMRSSRTDEWRKKMSKIMLDRLHNGTAPDTSRENNSRWRSEANIDHLIEVAHSYRCRSRSDLVKWSGYSQSLITRILDDFGMTYAEFAEKHIVGGYKLCVKGNKGIKFGPQRNVAGGRNHKVVSVRRVGVEDCYDLTVDEHHNFAVSAGVFVHNSQEDVQFARAIMRVQREICNGFRKVCRVHLSALGLAPHSVEYELHMTTPSTIFDLARMEVWSAKADLSDRMKENVPMLWILQRIFQFSEEEAVELMTEKDKETIHQAEVEATAEVKAEDIRAAGEKKREGQGGTESRELPRVTLARSSKSIEKMMTENNMRPSDVRRLDDKMDRLMRENGDLRKRLTEIGKFLNEVRYAMRNGKQAA